MNEDTSNSSLVYEAVTTASDLKTKLEAGANVRLQNDIDDCNAMITINNRTVSLDLNGHTITFINANGSHGIAVKNGAELTISSSVSTPGSIVRNISDGAHSVIGVNGTNSSKSSLILNNCNISVNDSDGNISGYGILAGNYSLIESGPNVEITAGYSAISGNGTLTDADVTISGGKYTSNTSAAIFFPSTSKLTVTGGEFIGKTGFDIRAGTVSISNATINLNKTGTTDTTGSSGPSSWGMGVAVIDHSSYASDSNIAVTINDVTVTGAKYDIYVGDLNRNTIDGSFINTNLDTSFTSNHKISLTVSKNSTDVLKYNAEKSSSIGRTISSIDGVIEVNSIATLQNAVNLCSGTIKLTSAINFTTDNSNPIKFLKKATLDLNGNILTLNGMARIEVGAGGDLTITDSSTTSVGKIDYTVASNENSAIKVAGTDASNLAKLTLEKCEIVVNENDIGNGYGVYAASYSEVTSGDGVTITAGYSAISGNGLNSGAKITITGGSYTSDNFAAIYFPSTNKLTVTGGTFTGKSGFDIRAGTVTISGAEINATGSYGDVADTSKSTRTDIPTVWGMGIAIIDHASYSKGAEISITLSNLTFSSTTSVCDLYIGDFNQNAGKFNENNLDETFTVNKSITVTVTDVLKYSVTKSANETSGYLIVNDLNTSNKTFTVTNLFNKGDATVENKGTIVVNDLNDLINAAAIGGNIQLAANITIKDMKSALELINETTLDLNGHTITIEKIGKAGGDIKNQETYSIASGLPANANRIVIADNATVTIKDSVGTGKIKYTEDADVTGTYKVKSPIKVGSATSSTLILDNVIIESTEYGVVVFTNGNLTVNGGSITSEISAISGNGLESDCKITLNGGTYTSTTTAAIFFPSTADLTVKGGTFTGKSGFDIRAGTVSITDAKINISVSGVIGSTGTSGPSSWKMGVAVIDHSSYAAGTSIDVTIDNVTVTGAEYDLYVGDLNRDTTGEFLGIDGNITLKHGISVNVNGSVVYSGNADAEKGRFVSDIEPKSSGGSGGVPVTPPTDPEEPVVKEEEIENEDGTISSITETTVTKENDDGSKETTIEKEEVVKDKDGNVQSVIEEKQSEVVNKDGSTNKTSETVVKDKDGKVIEEKTEIEIEDKNTGVSTSVEVTKDSEGNTNSEIKTQTSVETKDGKAQVDSKTLDEALKQAEAAKKAAEEKGAKDAKPVIEINAENSEDFTETEISAEDLSKLAEAEVDVKIKTTTGEINLPPEVSKNLSSNADEKVSLSFGEADKEQLTEDQKKTVGDAPVFEFNLKSGENDIHDLGGTVSVTVPYELKAGEDPNKITVWYIDESGKPIAMNSVYDPETKSITFETSHFSYYFIAEDTAVPDDKKDDSSNNTIYYAVAAVIIILIIIALAYYFMKKKQ